MRLFQRPLWLPAIVGFWLMCAAATTVRASSSPAAPEITRRPLSRLAAVGETVSFSVEATSVGDLSYEWIHNGRLIPGATTAALTLSGLTLADRGWYRVKVTNSAGGEATSVTLLAVAPGSMLGATVAGWGNNAYGQTNTPAGLGSVVAISTRYMHNLALEADGTVTAWGYNATGQLNIPADLSEVVAVAAGNVQSVALRADGTLVAWGGNANGETTLPAGLRDVVGIAAGSGFTLALKADGTVVSFGSGSAVPAGVNQVVAIAAGTSHSLALKADGTVVAWGNSSSGQATAPAGLTGVTAMAGGIEHSLALLANGTVVAWGADYAGQATVPPGLSGVVEIAAERERSLALKADGSVVAWGKEFQDQLNPPANFGPARALAGGDSHAIAIVPLIPVVFQSQPAPQDVAVGGTVTLAVTVTGSAPFVFQWKKNGVALPAQNSALGSPPSSAPTLTLTNLQESDGGDYSVDVTNAAGTVTSTPVALHVIGGGTVPPVIRGMTPATAYTATSSIAVMVNAAGGQPLTYQWYRGPSGDVSAPIAGAVDATLTLLPPFDAQHYWVRVTNPAGASDSAAAFVLPWSATNVGLGTTNLFSASYANGRYFVGTDGLGAAMSSDGASWSAAAVPAGRVAYGNGIYTTGMGHTGGSIYFSSDGTHWNFTNSGQSSAIITRVLFNGTRFVAVGDRGSISTSVNGVNWTLAYANSSGVFSDLAIGGGVHVAVGLSGRIVTSPDGLVWTAVPPPTTHPFRAVTWGDGEFVAFAGSAFNASETEIWTSANGTLWTQQFATMPNGVTIPDGNTSVAFGGGMFVAAVGKTLLMSDDGASWSVQPDFLPNQTIYPLSIVYGNGRFVFAGQGGVVLESPPVFGAPVLSTTGEDRFVVGGNSTVVTVAASGRNLTYQWYRGTSGDVSAPIAGATAASFDAGPVHVDQSYWVRVSSGSEFVDSRTVAVFIALPPAIITAQRDFEPIAGATVTLTAQINSRAPVDLQWYRGSAADTTSPVPGATTSSLTINAGTTTDHYWLRASNLAGTVDSPDFRLTPWSSYGGRGTLGTSQVRQLGELVVGVGGDHVSTFAPGVGWTPVATISNALLSDIGEYDGLYVAVGGHGFFTSEDLHTWTPRNITPGPTPAGAVSLAHGNGVWVAVGQAEYMSSDGINWHEVVRPPGVTFRSVVFDRGQFVAGGGLTEVNNPQRDNIAVIFSSPDGIIWTQKATDVLPDNLTPPGSAFDRLESVGGMYIATSTGAGLVLHSLDGNTWTRTNFAPLGVAGGIFSSGYVNGRYFLGSDFNGYRSTADWLTWDVGFGPTGMSTLTLRTVNGELLAIGADGVVFATSDGVTWSQRSGVPLDVLSMAYGSGRFVAIGFYATYVSYDGFVWQKADLDISEQGSARLAYGDGIFVATTNRAGFYRLSFDGSVWGTYQLGISQYTGVAAAGSRIFILGATLRDVAFGQDRYVAVGNGIATSLDGSNWTQVATNSGSALTSVAYGNNTFVAVGGSGGQGLILSSTDGLTWTQRTAPTSTNGLNDVVFAGDRFLVATTQGLAFSTDGASWYLTEGLGTNVLSLTLANGTVFGTGRDRTIWRRALDGVATSIIALSEPNEITAGSSTTLHVSTSGQGLTFQWYRGESGNTEQPIAGATGATLVTPAATTDQSYWVRVKGLMDVVDSAAVKVFIIGPPVIRARPFSADILAGQTATLRVEAETFTAATYQWFEGRKGDTSHPLSLGTGPACVVSPGTNARRYWVRITNVHGSTDSDEVLVTPWQSISLSTDDQPFATIGLAYGQGRYVVTGLAPTAGLPGIVQYSDDSVTWARISSPPLGNVVFGNGRFVAVGRLPSSTLYSSPDGISWTANGILPTVQYSDVYFLGGHFFALGRNGSLLTSPDGLTWTSRAVGAQPLLGAAYGNGRYVVCGAGGKVFTSTDMAEWTPAAAFTTMDLSSVAFGVSQFFALAADSSLYTSTDGFTWAPANVLTAENSRMLAEAKSISYVAGRLFAAPSNYQAHGYVSFQGVWWWSEIAGMGRVLSANGNLVASNITTVVATDGSSVSANSGGRFFRALPEPPVPVVTIAPASQVGYATGSVTISVVVTSDTPVSYQWRKNGVDVPGATSAQLTLTNLQGVDAGSYSVRLTNASGAVESGAATLTVSPPIAPVITVQPQPQLVNAGMSVTFAVVATGAPPPAYSWRKNGMPIDAANAASFTLAEAHGSDAGSYSVSVSNAGGTVVSDSAVLNVIPAGVNATQAVIGSFYVAGGSVTVANTFAYGGSASDLSWQVLLPAGWTFASSGGDQGDASPGAGAGGLLEWTWANPPPSPVRFTYTLNTPPESTGDVALTALISFQSGTTPVQFTARPDPLVLRRVAWHDADTNQDGRFSLTELLRVIEIYNTRNGTVRTGAYLVDATNLEDGFANDPARANTTTVTLAKYHSADSNHDGKLSLTELLRLIELYNFRAGTVRTGQYHLQPLGESEDGFGTGP